VMKSAVPCESGFCHTSEEIMYYVYSLKCKDGYYVGCTNAIEERLERHQKGHVPATAGHQPVSLEFYFATVDKYKAFAFEKYLKSGSGRAFIKKHLSDS
jgi:predicted GIY-YIG superfamily endonuclease